MSQPAERRLSFVFLDLPEELQKFARDVIESKEEILSVVHEILKNSTSKEEAITGLYIQSVIETEFFTVPHQREYPKLVDQGISKQEIQMKITEMDMLASLWVANVWIQHNPNSRAAQEIAREGYLASPSSHVTLFHEMWPTLQLLPE